jgi:hypothetical protein
VDLQTLIVEAENLPKTRDDSGALMAVGPCQFPQLGPAITEAINEIAEVLKRKPLYVMVNALPPECIVIEHTDTVIGKPLRFHLPLVTNNGAFWWDERDGIDHFREGVWVGPIPYYLKHRVGNLGKQPRTHLVVDLDNGL